MSDGSTSFRKLYVGPAMSEEKLNEFLTIIGIAYKNKQIICNRNIEVFSMRIFFCFIIITCAGLQRFVSFWKYVLRKYLRWMLPNLFLDPDMDVRYSMFQFEFHKNLESLNSVKKAPPAKYLKRARMEFYST